MGSAVHALNKPAMANLASSTDLTPFKHVFFTIPQPSPTNDEKRQFIPSEVNAYNAMLCMVMQKSLFFFTHGQCA